VVLYMPNWLKFDADSFAFKDGSNGDAVKYGISDLTAHWLKQMRKYLNHVEARLIQVSMTPDQLVNQPEKFFTRSTMK
jgi:hypothetical protein